MHAVYKKATLVVALGQFILAAYTPKEQLQF